MAASTESIVDVDELRITSREGDPPVDGVSFTLARGGSLGLVGESGSGKSLTALTIMGLLPAGLAAVGRVEVDGADVLAMGKDELRAMRGDQVGMVFQDPFTSLNPVFTIRHQMFAVLREHGTVRSRAELEVAAADALADVGLDRTAGYLDRYPFQLSGGQAQRVAIAMALLPGPALLIADEPTTALDVTVQAGILRLIERLRETRELSLIFISHDLAVVARMCERLCIMQAGRIVESGLTSEIIGAPRADYTRLLLDSVADFSAVGGGSQ